MDLVSRRYLIYVSQHGSQPQALSPITSPGSSIFHPHQHASSTSFPIIAIAIIGIMATAFLLVSYYIFVIKCCLNWHRIDVLRRFSPSRRREDPPPTYSPATDTRGLDEALIRLIPVTQYKAQQGDDRDFGERRFCECAVCLLSLIHISEPTRPLYISYAVFCLKKIFLMIRRPPRSTPKPSSAASDVYKRQAFFFFLPS